MNPLLPRALTLNEAAVGRVGADLLALAVGMICWIEMTLLGRLYLGEVFLALCSIAFPLLYVRLGAERERKWITGFFIFGLAYFCALCLTDLYRNNAASDYLRGWARAGILFTNVAGLLVVGYLRPRRLMLFIAGSALSQLVLSAMGGRPGDWKSGIAYPVSLGVLLLLDSRRPARATLVLLGLAALNLVLDYRALAGFFLLTGLALAVKGKRGRPWLRPTNVTLAGIVIVGFVALYGVTSHFQTRGTETSLRRYRSNAERAAGLIVGYQFVKASPLIGYGSWPRSDEALETWAVLQGALGTDEQPAQIEQQALESPEGNLIRTHSMILQAWVEGGFVGVLFFGFSAVMVTRLAMSLIVKEERNRFDALALFLGIWGLWAFVASPFGGDARLTTALSLVVLLCLQRKERVIESR